MIRLPDPLHAAHDVQDLPRVRVTLCVDSNVTQSPSRSNRPATPLYTNQAVSTTHLPPIMNLSSKPAQSLYTGINASASDGMRTWSHPDCAARKSVALTLVVPSHLDNRDFHNLAPETPAAPVGQFTVMRQSA